MGKNLREETGRNSINLLQAKGRGGECMVWKKHQESHAGAPKKRNAKKSGSIYSVNIPGVI